MINTAGSFLQFKSLLRINFGCLVLLILVSSPAHSTPLIDQHCENRDEKITELGSGIGYDDVLIGSRTACYIRKAIDSKDYRYCKHVLGSSGEGDCVKRVAVAAKDYTPCLKLKRDDQYHSKRQACLLWYAAELKDQEVCRKFFPGGLGSPLGNCLQNAAPAR